MGSGKQGHTEAFTDSSFLVSKIMVKFQRDHANWGAKYRWGGDFSPLLCHGKSIVASVVSLLRPTTVAILSR